MKHVSGGLVELAMLCTSFLSQKGFGNTKFAISLFLDQHLFPFTARPDYFGEEFFELQLAFIGHAFYFQLLENIQTTCLLALCPSRGVE